MSTIKKPLYDKILEKIPVYPGKKNIEMFEQLNNSMKDISKENLEKIKVPTLVVNVGKKDVVPEIEARFLAENIPNSQFLILDKEGHFSYMINCSWYEELKEFLNKGE